MELGQLRVFLAVMDMASVTRAAETVGLSPGAVSQQLRALGADLGVELFIRAGRKIAPDRKSTRLNSSHLCISDAVFCLKNNIHYSSFLHIRGVWPGETTFLWQLDWR